MFTVITAIMIMLSPPSIKEIKHNERVEYRLPDGYGINNIRVSVPVGREQEGLDLAEELFRTLQNEQQNYTVQYKGVECTTKAHSRLEAVNKMKHWYEVIGQAQ